MRKHIIITALISMIFVSNIYAVELGGIDIHGYIAQGYLISDKNNYMADTDDGTFHFSEKGINFASRVTERLHLGLQLVSITLGDQESSDIELGWAYADYRILNWLGLRGGRLKLPVGMYNETRDIDMLRTSILLPQSVYAEPWRDALSAIDGFGLYGEIPMSLAGSLDYQIYMGVMELEKDSWLADFIIDTGYIESVDLDADNLYGASLFWNTPLEGLKIGGSVFITSSTLYGKFIPKYDKYGIINAVTDALGRELIFPINLDNIKQKIFSLEYIWNNLTIAAEYMRYRTDIEIDREAVIFEYDIPPETYDLFFILFPELDVASMDLDVEGYYYGLAYRFCSWFELGAYYSALYRDEEDKRGREYSKSPLWKLPGSDKNRPAYNAWLKDFCVSARFDINEYWTIKLEGHSMDGAFGVSIWDNLPSVRNPNGTYENWNLYAAKMTFSF